MNQNHNTPNWQDEQALERYRMLPVEPQTSRLLDVLERKHEDRRQIQANAISFSGFRKDTNGGDDNV